MGWTKRWRLKYSRANLQSNKEIVTSSLGPEQGDSLAWLYNHNWNLTFRHGPHFQKSIRQQELIPMRKFILEKRKPRKMCLLLSNIWRASMEKKDLTSRVAPVGGGYSLTDFSTSSISSQTGENSPLPRPTSPPNLLPHFLLGLDQHLSPFWFIAANSISYFQKKRSLPISQFSPTSPSFYSMGLYTIANLIVHILRHRWGHIYW